MNKNSNNSPRKSYSVSRKAEILRAHLVGKKPISDVCDEYGIQPSLYYSWQKQLFDNMEQILETKPHNAKRNGRETEAQRQIEALRAKLDKKNAVIAEISEEFVTLKKELGEP